MAKVLKSGDSNFQEGDLVWGMIGWEEYSIVNATQSALFKIHDKNVPLSYYTGILGELFSSQYNDCLRNGLMVCLYFYNPLMSLSISSKNYVLE